MSLTDIFTLKIRQLRRIWTQVQFLGLVLVSNRITLKFLSVKCDPTKIKVPRELSSISASFTSSEFQERKYFL